MTTDLEKEREAFEAWAKQHYGYREFSLEPFLPISDHWRGSWSAWQARAALAAPAAPQERPNDIVKQATEALRHLSSHLGWADQDAYSKLADALEGERLAAPQEQETLPATGNWRDEFSLRIYENLAAADNQDLPLEEYPSRILSIMDAMGIGAAQVPVAYETIKGALREDDAYAWSWHCNLAMPIMDAIHCTHRQANDAAARLMGHLFGIDVTGFQEWKACIDGAAPQGGEDAQPDDECLALDLLETLFDAWENGIACYEDPESNGAFLGNAFRLDDDTVNACASLLNRRRPRDGATPQPAPQAAPAEELAAARQEIERLNSIINTPQADDFLRAVSTEAEHQRQRWGSEHDAGKAPADWFWLLGYLGGKALHAHSNDNMEKAEHHIITTAAVCANWHRAMFGKTDMRPGIDGEAALTTQGADHG